MARRSKDEIAALKRSIAALKGHATRKIKQAEDQGIKVTSSALDPRYSSLKGKSAKELDKVAKELREYNKNEKIIRGADGVPLSGAKYERYLEAARKVNERYGESGEGISTVPNGLTLKENQNFGKGIKFDPTDPVNPLVVKAKNASNIRSGEALDKLIAKTEKKLTKEYYNSVAREMRESIGKMTEISGNPEIGKKFRKLTQGQRDLLIYNTPFMHEIKLIYAGNNLGMNDVVEHTTPLIHQYLDWAREQDR